MQPFELKPQYSTEDIPGKCIKCLAEQELDSCLRELLKEEVNNQKLQQRYESLASFLRSPDAQRIRDESERLLAEGKQVTLRIHSKDGKPSYELEVK